MKSKEIYNDVFVRFGIEHGMFALLESNKARFASVSLYRDESRAQFTSSDMDILQFLTPHLQRAFKLHLQFSELKANSDGFETALDMLPLRAIFFGPKGKVVAMNRSATTILAERDGLLAKLDVLAAELPGESSLLARAILQATITSNDQSFAAGGIELALLL